MTPAKPASSSLYQFALGALVLWLIAKHVPHGTEIALMVLVGVLLSTPDAIAAFSGALKFLESGT